MNKRLGQVIKNGCVFSWVFNNWRVPVGNSILPLFSNQIEMDRMGFNCRCSIRLLKQNEIDCKKFLKSYPGEFINGDNGDNKNG